MVNEPMNDGPIWCRDDEPHREHRRHNQFGGQDYCSGRPRLPDTSRHPSYAIRRANDALSRINHPDHAQRPTLHDLVVVIQDLRTELHIRKAKDNMTNHTDGGGNA